MNKSEIKFRNTALKMNEAIFKLLETSRITEITVAQVCRKAGVNRSTFYAHYNNIYELLSEARDNFMKTFLSNYPLTIEDLKKRNDVNMDNFISREYMIPYLKHVSQNKNVLKIFVANAEMLEVDNFYEKLLNYVFIPACQKYGLENKKIVNYVAKFFLNAIVSVLMEWIKGDCEDDVNLICDTIIMCVKGYQNINV